MAWKQLGAAASQGAESGVGQPIMKWREGLKLVGRLIARRENKNGPLMDFRDDNMGLVVLSVPAMLATQLQGVANGSRLMIECLGKIQTARGNSLWNIRSAIDE